MRSSPAADSNPEYHSLPCKCHEEYGEACKERHTGAAPGVHTAGHEYHTRLERHIHGNCARQRQRGNLDRDRVRRERGIGDERGIDIEAAGQEQGQCAPRLAKFGLRPSHQKGGCSYGEEEKQRGEQFERFGRYSGRAAARLLLAAPDQTRDDKCCERGGPQELCKRETDPRGQDGRQ